MNVLTSLITIHFFATALANPGLLGSDNNIEIGISVQVNRPQPEDSQVGTHSLSLLRLFLAFQIINQTLLSALVLTFTLVKSVKRHPIVVNTCIMWIMIGAISSLLFYAGKGFGPEPSFTLCATQASLLDGVLPLGSTGIFALTYQLYLNVVKPQIKKNTSRTALLILVPYFSFASFVLGGAVSVTQSPQNLSRDRRFFYCSIDGPISNAFTIFTAIFIFVAIGFAISIYFHLYRHWWEVRRMASIEFHLLLRLAVFGVYVVIAFIISVLSLSNPHSPFPDLFAASIGPAYAFVLASQPDVYRTWFRVITRRKKGVQEANDNDSLIENRNGPSENQETFQYLHRDVRVNLNDKPLPPIPEGKPNSDSV